MGKQDPKTRATPDAGTAVPADNRALYRQYRPKSIDSVVGQEHITATLSHALKTGKLAHAYLFTGPRGVGKTSIARILAHEINGLPYTDDSMHLDIIEIDAASNRRIDEIRELRDKVNLAPAQAKYKVYIIDEVHMLTREAFNALLKTLEEPPAHVVFILATTESHKLPETIVSRTQRFMFKPVDQDKVVAHLRSIADSEGLAVSDEALALIAAHGEGSFRDSISLLDQTRGYGGGAVDADFVRSLTGQPTEAAITALAGNLQRHDAVSIVQDLTGLRGQGFAAPQVARQLARQLRKDVLSGTIPHGVFDLLQKLLDVPSAHDPDSYLELVLLEYALAGRQAAPSVATTTPLPAATPATATRPKATGSAPSAAAAAPSASLSASAPAAKPAARATPAADKPADAPSAKHTEAPQQAAAAPAAAEPVISLAPPPDEQSVTDAAADTPAGPVDVKPLDTTTWPQVLDRLRQSHNTLYGIARMSRPEFEDGTVRLYFRFPFHQRRINEAKNRDIVLAAIRTATGREVVIQCLLEERADGHAAPAVSHAAEPSAAPAPQPVPAPQAVTDPAVLATINDIFGGAEVLGSQ